MLRDMLPLLAEATNLKPSDPAQRVQLLRYINQAALELYSSTDLPGAIAEIRVLFDSTDGNISLPWYVDEVRGIRRVNYGELIKVTDKTPRFAAAHWQQPGLRWEVLGRQPLIVPISIEGQLTATIPIAQNTTFTVTIRGQTSVGKVTENLVFPPGTVSKTTTAQFTKENPDGIEMIAKDEVTTADVSVADASGTNIALIPNITNVANNIIMRVRDTQVTLQQVIDPYVDILYKRVFVPLTLDTDTFIDRKLESALVYIARSYHAGLSKDDAATQRAVLALARGEKLAAQVIKTEDLETEARIATGPNPTDRAWRNPPAYIYQR